MGDLGSVLGGIGKVLGGAAFPGTYANQAMGSLIGGPMSGVGMMGEMLNPGEKMFGMTSPMSQIADALPKPGENQQGAIDPRMIIDESGAMGAPQQQDVQVTGDGWNPRKPTVLGTIADAFLMSRGGKPMFSMMRDRRNVNEAMGGYVDDPVQAMKRLSQIPGQEQNVVKMINQYRDDQRADLSADSLRDSRSERYYDRLGTMFGRIQDSKDPEAAYKQTLPVLRSYVQRNDLQDDVELPDEYDSAVVDSYISGKALDDRLKRQMLQQHRDRTYDLNERRYEDQRNYRQERLEDFDNAEAGRNNRYNTPKPKAGGMSDSQLIRDKDGTGKVVGVISKSGRVAKLIAPDGSNQYFEVVNGRVTNKRIPNELVEKPKK